MPKKKLKKKKKDEDEDSEVEFDLGESFEPAEGKMDDFDLDLDASQFRGKKGQAGTRRK